MKRFNYQIPALILNLALLIGSCINTNKIQYQKVRSNDKTTYSKVDTKQEVKAPSKPYETKAETAPSTAAAKKSENLQQDQKRSPNKELTNTLSSEKPVYKKIVREELYQQLKSIQPEPKLKLDEEPKAEDKEVSDALGRFNFMHYFMLVCFLLGLALIGLAIILDFYFLLLSFPVLAVTVYVFSILQIVNAKNKIPLKDRDKAFKRKLNFAKFILIFGSILLAIGLIGGIITVLLLLF